MSTNITWKVSGSNWQETIQAPVSACAMEIATSAVENIWARPHNEANPPSVGFVLEISHEKMKSKGEHVIVLSALVLANAGFHEESAELNRLWEKQKLQP